MLGLLLVPAVAGGVWVAVRRRGGPAWAGRAAGWVAVAAVLVPLAGLTLVAVFGWNN